MTWKPPKINYIPSDGVTDEDLNRVEGNTLANHDRLDGHDSDISSNDSDIANHENRVDNIEDGTTKVPSASQADHAVHADTADNATNADNADKLDSKHWVLVTSGNILALSDSTEEIALRSGGHNYYRYSLYGGTYINLAGGAHSTTTNDFFGGYLFAYVRKSPIGTFDDLRIQNHGSFDCTVYYEVYSWE